MPKLTDGTWVDRIHYSEDGEEFDGAEFYPCNWSYATDGCGCCSASGGMSATDAHEGCVRLAEHHRQMADDYDKLAALARKETDDANPSGSGG